MRLLTESIQAGSLLLTNRLVMPPMATSKALADGEVSQAILDYYEEKTSGGYISLVITEHSFISQEGKASNNQMSIATDDMIAGLEKLAKVIQQNGSKAIIQINHAGNAARSEVTGMSPVGPSAVARPGREVPKELTKEDIKQIIVKFKEASLRAKKAGFDGVEIHASHGYLLSQFFSPIINKRSDEYGGSVLNRIRFHLEIIEAVRETVGKDFTIIVRLGASDHMDGGATIDDGLIAAQAFENAGVDILDISGGLNGYTIPGKMDQQGYFSSDTEAIKRKVSIPVILTGGITDVRAAEKLLQDKKTDLVGVGRAILEDSNWAKKAIENIDNL